jgi:hypothetical protein
VDECKHLGPTLGGAAEAVQREEHSRGALHFAGFELAAEQRGHVHEVVPDVRGLRSSTFQLNVSASSVIGGPSRDYYGDV